MRNRQKTCYMPRSSRVCLYLANLGKHTIWGVVEGMWVGRMEGANRPGKFSTKIREKNLENHARLGNMGYWYTGSD